MSSAKGPALLWVKWHFGLWFVSLFLRYGAGEGAGADEKNTILLIIVIPLYFQLDERLAMVAEFSGWL